MKIIAEKVKETSFVKEYRDQVSDEEALGVALSKYFKWNGTAIAKVAYAGFEDSNFHNFNEKFNDLWKSANGGVDLY